MQIDRLSQYANQKIRPEELNPYIDRLNDHRGVLHQPSDAFQYFYSKRAIVDLGCGNGHFLQTYLTTHPEFVGLGVDRRYKRLYKTAQKLADLNSRVIRWDVLDFIQKCPSEIWDEVWMQFPDPWPKKRHAKNRMVNLPFFYNVFRVLKEGGRFCFISDCELYWDFLIESNQRSKLFAVSRSLQGDLFSDQASSLFKKIFISNGTPLYSLEFRKSRVSLNYSV